MSKRNRNRQPVTPAEPVADVATVAVVGTEPEPVADVATVETVPTETAVSPATEPEPVAVAGPVAHGLYRFTGPNGDTFDCPVSPIIARVAFAVAGVADVTGTDATDTFAARVAHVRSRFNAAGPVVDFARVGLNRSPFGANVTETQNLIYAAVAVAGVPVTSAAVVAAWRALLPVTKCDFESHTRYGFSTFADFANGRHGTVPTVPVGTWSRMMAAWYAADGPSKPWPVPVAVVG